MDQVQKSLCDRKNQKPACLKDRNILRSVLADYLPNNKLKQNLLLNAFDNDVVQVLNRSSDITSAALNCFSQLENDYGITKDAAFGSIQTWCYLLGLSTTADALEIVKPIDQPASPVANPTISTESAMVLGIYRAGTDFPFGEISLQIKTKAKLAVFYGVGKNPNRLDTNQNFMDKAYIRINEGQYLKLESYETGVPHQFIVKSLEGGN